MANTSKDQLFSLIKSLSKAEKRNFKLYVHRFEGAGESRKFIQLFDALDKLAEYDEDLLFKRLPHIKKQHLANLKRHLYKQILISLRLIFIQKNIDIEIREQIDFARILYGKGMYMQALKLLDRIKQIAIEHHQDILHLEILEFQKLIEARHITRSRQVKNKMENLLEESSRRSAVTSHTSLLFNFNIQVHGWYIQHGHARNEKDRQALQLFYDQNMPAHGPPGKLTFFEKANLYQAKMWYHYILLDFQACRQSAEAWVSLFDESPMMREKDPDLYMRSLYYLLVTLYFLRDQHVFGLYLQDFESFFASHSEQLNANSRTIAFVYLNLSKLNANLLSGDYTSGVQQIAGILEALPQYENNLDIHRSLLFFYKFAYLYFGSGQYDKALDYLNDIILLKHGYLREDLHHNARLLQLICHFELGNYDLLHYLVPAVQRAFSKAKDVSKVQRLTLQWLKKLADLPPGQTKAAFEEFQSLLAEAMKSPYEQKALLYLNVPAWVERRLADRGGAIGD
ncbi:MAG: hypothetical protein IPN33_09890 [Saprospiraceae bacterium]|nr:hypothetical protein [Saprospiraceae bacterium]